MCESYVQAYSNPCCSASLISSIIRWYGGSGSTVTPKLSIDPPRSLAGERAYRRENGSPSDVALPLRVRRRGRAASPVRRHWFRSLPRSSDARGSTSTDPIGIRCVRHRHLYEHSRRRSRITRAADGRRDRLDADPAPCASPWPVVRGFLVLHRFARLGAQRPCRGRRTRLLELLAKRSLFRRARATRRLSLFAGLRPGALAFDTPALAGLLRALDGNGHCGFRLAAGTARAEVGDPADPDLHARDRSRERMAFLRPRSRPGLSFSGGLVFSGAAEGDTGRRGALVCGAAGVATGDGRDRRGPRNRRRLLRFRPGPLDRMGPTASPPFGVHQPGSRNFDPAAAFSRRRPARRGTSLERGPDDLRGQN